MTSHSTNRVYLGTINPGGSVSRSGGGGPVRTRPYTTPAAPGRATSASLGSSGNALTVLSSHPASRRTVSPPDDDLVIIEEELSSRSSSSFESSSQRSSRSESVSSVPLESPVRQSKGSLPVASTTAVRSSQDAKGDPSRSTPSASPPLPQTQASTSGNAKENPTTSQLDTTKNSVAGDDKVPKKAKPIIEASKAKISATTKDGKGETKQKSTLEGQKVQSKSGAEESGGKPKTKETGDKTSKTKTPKVSSTGSPGATNTANSSNSVSGDSMQREKDKKRPATAGATTSTGTKPKCVSLGRKELIGKGSFGMVYKALDLDTNRLLAVKEIPLDGPNLQQLPTVRREIQLMEKLSHPNIVQCFGHDIEGQYLRIYMEYVAGGCVSSLLRNFGSFQERQASIVTRQVLSGLQYLHDRKIAHRDLKGDNILLQPDGTVKLADFGTARELATTAMSLAGTAYFMAPEMIKGTGHGLEADIWSVGCCIIEMLTGKPPFSHLVNQYAIMTHIAESEGPFDDAFPKNVSPGVIRILRQCVVKDPSKRATCAQLLEEEWVKNPPPNAEMKGPLVLETNTVSEVRERVQRKNVTAAAKATSTVSSTPTTTSTIRSVKGVTGSTRGGAPLSSFNPMLDED